MFRNDSYPIEEFLNNILFRSVPQDICALTELLSGFCALLACMFGPVECPNYTIST